MTDIKTAVEEAYAKVEAEAESENSSSKDDAQQVAPEQAKTDNGQDADTSARKSDKTDASPEDSGRVRDKTGRFAAKNEQKSDNESAQKSSGQATDKSPEQPTRNPFSSWKPDAQAALRKAEMGEALTPEELKLIRIEAERRESDFHRGVSEFKSHSERARAYDAAVAPYQQHLNSLGVDAPTAIKVLLNAEVKLRTSDPVTKAQYFAQLAKEYGVDLGQVQAPPQVDQQTQYLMQQLNELRQSQQMWQNQIYQQEQIKAQQELSQFATADRPHFDAVRVDMADLLETGKAQSMQEAYEMAVWMRPDIRSALIEQQRADAQRKAMEAAQNQRAKTAAVSVKGSSPASGGSQSVNGSIRDILMSSLADT